MTLPATPTIAPAPGLAPLPTGRLSFPAGFVWGVAAASYQIEGAATEDGRTPSIWDAFCRVPGAVLNGDDGDVACDHYHRMPEDVALMARLGVASYRFSVSWPRVRPDAGPVNAAGLVFYDRLVDELLAHDVAPWLTLYHWDLPQVLEDAGGWTERDTAYRFLDYAMTVHDALGDRVSVWTTLNEPWCSAFLGYASGAHAPGRQEPVAGLVAAHHLLLGHGLVVDELRRRDPALQLGITLNLTVADPADPEDAADVDAARRIDGLHNRIFLDPLLRGSHPVDVLADTSSLTWQGSSWLDVVHDGDLDLIAAPLDVLGVNYYHGDAVSGHAHEHLSGEGFEEPARPTGSPYPTAEHVTFPSRGLPVTDMGWEIQPEGLHRLLRRLDDDYDVPPLYLTETGAAYGDGPGPDGAVHDTDRIAFMDAHLRAIHLAIADGVDVRGIYQWTWLDNFEWAYGYVRRFGLVHVDFETQRRTPKDSALWYAGVASTGALPPLDQPGSLA